MPRCFVKLLALGPILFCLVGAAWADGMNLVQNGNFTGTSVPTQFCENGVNGTAPCVTDNLPANLCSPVEDATQTGCWGNDPAGDGTNPSPNGSYTGLNQVSPSSETGITALSDYSGNYLAFTSPADYPNGSGQDCLYQNLTTVIGATYTLTFDLAIVGSSNNLFFAPEWDSGGNDPYFDVQNGYTQFSQFSGAYGQTSSSGNVQFEQFQLQLQAESSTTTLWFHGNDLGGAVLLADVSLTENSAAPEPASLWLVGTGIAMLGLRVRRARAARQ